MNMYCGGGIEIRTNKQSVGVLNLHHSFATIWPSAWTAEQHFRPTHATYSYRRPDNQVKPEGNPHGELSLRNLLRLRRKSYKVVGFVCEKKKDYCAPAQSILILFQHHHYRRESWRK